jgi:hypothetical protein
MPVRQIVVSAALLFLVLTVPNPGPLFAPGGAWAASEASRLTVRIDGMPGTTVTFDRAQLEALGTTIIRTTTAWTEGVTEFEGVLFRDVLTAAGVEGAAIKVSALNDYSYTLPMTDVKAYPVILAFKMNGRYLTRRDKGPLWVIYPRDAYPELNTKEIDHRMVWQVNQITVR